MSPFAGREGYGAPAEEYNQVLSLLGPHPPLYYYFLDRVVHKPKYTSDSGRVLAYILNRDLFRFTGAIKDKMAEWILNVLRSPLSEDFKSWFLRMCNQRLGEAPPLIESVLEGEQEWESIYGFIIYIKNDLIININEEKIRHSLPLLNNFCVASVFY